LENEVDTPVSTLTPFQEWAKLPESDVVTSEAEIDTASKTPPASEPETKPAEETEPELPKGLKKRFSELTGQIRDLKAQLAKPAAPEVKPGVATPPEPAKVPETGKPVAANFTTYEEYVEALTDWKLEQRDALRIAVDAKASQAQTVKTQVEAARLAHPDYDDVVTNEIPISVAMAEVLVGMAVGAEVAYYLGSNPTEAARIAKLSPARAGAALAKIEAALEGPSSATPKPKAAALSRAPAPPKTITGSGGNVDAEPDPSDFVKWNKWMDREYKRNHPDA
jgi:hypothetical protein